MGTPFAVDHKKAGYLISILVPFGWILIFYQLKKIGVGLLLGFGSYGLIFITFSIAGIFFAIAKQSQGFDWGIFGLGSVILMIGIVVNFWIIWHFYSKWVDEILGEIKRRTKEEETKEEETKEEETKKTKGIYDGIEKNTTKIKQEWGRLNSEEKRILESANEYEILGVAKNADLIEIKKQWKSLIKKYNASRGLINRTKVEQDKITVIQRIIGKAFEKIKENQK